MNRREFLMAGGALALAGCGTVAQSRLPGTGALDAAGSGTKKAPEFHVFSKMFQSPMCPDYEAVAELMARAGFDGIEWTVRPKGHILPENAKRDLPKAVAAARRQGLKSTMMVTAITNGQDPASLELLKIAADCGVTQYRPGYYFYDEQKESFAQSLQRIRAGFASLAAAGERTGLKAVYQNHSSWNSSMFGSVVWDLYAMIRELDPRYLGIEYDPMHAYYETGLAWRHGLELVAPRIGAVCLKDFTYAFASEHPQRLANRVCPAGAGAVPWDEVKSLLQAHAVQAPFIVHFEYELDQTKLFESVKAELDAFKRLLA